MALAGLRQKFTNVVAQGAAFLFNMNTVPERIMGTEVEYATHWAGKNDPLSISRELFLGSISSKLPRLGNFLVNGARLYLDAGEHIEFATPECAGPLEATKYEIAGEHLVLETVRRIAAVAKRTAVVNKRLCDPKGNQWGSHHNFEIERQLFERVTAAPVAKEPPSYAQSLLVSHLATNSVFAGAGMYQNNGDYRVSQKKWRTTGAVTGGTTQEKGLINTRDEAHSGGYNKAVARLHVQAGEATMSPWATWMQLGTMSILLRVLEKGWEVDVPLLKEPSVAASVVAQDPTLTRTLRLRDGSELTGLDIQAHYAMLAQKAKGSGILSEQEAEVADSWSAITEDLANRDTVDCTDRVDWLCRNMLVELHVSERLDDDRKTIQRKQEVDLIYDRLGPDGIGYKLRARDHYALDFTDEAISRAVCQPPDTRARTRSDIIRLADNRGISSDSMVVTVGWDNATVYNRPVKLAGPRAYNPEIVSRVARRLDQHS